MSILFLGDFLRKIKRNTFNYNTTTEVVILKFEFEFNIDNPVRLQNL